MTEPIRIRKALPSDLEYLQAFEQGIIEAERPMDARLRTSRIHYYDLAAMLVDEAVELVLAICGAQPIGCGFARLEQAKPYVRHQQEAYLGLMFVDPEFRGRGVNQRILDHLVQWCRQKGVLELRLDVFDGNQAARRAYEKAGFSSNLIEMRLTLDDQPT